MICICWVFDLRPLFCPYQIGDNTATTTNNNSNNNKSHVNKSPKLLSYTLMRHYEWPRDRKFRNLKENDTIIIVAIVKSLMPVLVVVMMMMRMVLRSICGVVVPPASSSSSVTPPPSLATTILNQVRHPFIIIVAKNTESNNHSFIHIPIHTHTPICVTQTKN